MLILDTDNEGPIMLRCKGEPDSTNKDGSAIREFWIDPCCVVAIIPLLSGEGGGVMVQIYGGGVVHLRYMSVARTVKALRMDAEEDRREKMRAK